MAVHCLSGGDFKVTRDASFKGGCSMQLFGSELLPSFSFLCPQDPVLAGLSSTIHSLKAPGTEMGSMRNSCDFMVGQIKRQWAFCLQILALAEGVDSVTEVVVQRFRPYVKLLSGTKGKC